MRGVGVAVALIIMLKVHWANDMKLSLREDPLEMWIAIGIATLMLMVALRKEKS